MATLTNRILISLASGERKTATEIHRALGLSGDLDLVGRRLRELCAAGRIRRLDMGKGKVQWECAATSPMTNDQEDIKP